MSDPTPDFVPAHTLPADHERVQRQIKMQIAYYTRHPELIGIRLRQLDREWDIERIIEKKTAALAVVGTSVGTCVATAGSRCPPG